MKCEVCEERNVAGHVEINGVVVVRICSNPDCALEVAREIKKTAGVHGVEFEVKQDAKPT